MGKFGDALQSSAIGAIDSGLGMVMGIAGARAADARQRRQQERLQNLQMKGNKEMMDYQQKKQLEMWEATSYGAQKKMMMEAGLNPGLMYGMGGGGGQSVGGGGQGVSGASAAGSSGEAMQGAGMGMQMGMQAQMMQAQIELARSQANLNNVDAQKRAGVDTTEANTRIASLTQGIENAKALQDLQQAELGLKQYESQLAGKTLEQKIRISTYTADRLMHEVESAMADAKVDTATADSKIEIMQNEVIGTMLRNVLTSATTANVNAKTAGQNIENANMNANMYTERVTKWRNMQTNERNADIKKYLGDAGIDLQQQEQLLRIFQSIFSAGAKKPTEIYNVN